MMNNLANHEVSMLFEKDLRGFVFLNEELLKIIEYAMAKINDSKVVLPPILHMELNDLNAEIDIKTAYLPDTGGIAIKISTGFFNNAQNGLPSLSGLMLLVDSRNGKIQCILNDNGFLTDLRTAAAGGIASKYGANLETATATIVGTGLQARLQAKALTLVLPNLSKIFIWGRSFGKAQECSLDLKNLGIEVSADSNLQSCLSQSGVVVTTTSSKTPLITKEMLHEGLHITAMGSDAPYKNEIDAECLRETVYVADKLSQTKILGELHHALEKGINPKNCFEISEVIDRKVEVRENSSQITLFDLTGTGVQDSAIANHAYQLAQKNNLLKSIS